jgi:hypothetical protein
LLGGRVKPGHGEGGAGFSHAATRKNEGRRRARYQIFTRLFGAT